MDTKKGNSSAFRMRFVRDDVKGKCEGHGMGLRRILQHRVITHGLFKLHRFFRAFRKARWTSRFGIRKHK